MITTQNTLPIVKPSWDEFSALAQQGNIVPVYAQLAADYDTPLSAYEKIREGDYAFLLESAESSVASGRWSLLASDPKWVLSMVGASVEIKHRDGRVEQFSSSDDVLAVLERLMKVYVPVVHGQDPPPFYGGAVGYLGYDAVSQFERKVKEHSVDALGIPDAVFTLVDKLIVFDHKLRRILLVSNAFIEDGVSLKDTYDEAVQGVACMVEKLSRPLSFPLLNGLAEGVVPEFASNVSQDEFEHNVAVAQEYIKAGDIFQVVPSQRFSTTYTGSPSQLYRAQRHINPSPYMFIVEMPEFSLVGSSPEVHVRAIGGRIDIRPIAGTRVRGATPEEDEALALDLLGDAKECAEHLMLVDLARNDVGRIAEVGSVRVDDFMVIERYSHVMHIVSNVHGDLAPEKSSYDVLRATFPAGTVSGAPKIRAMQIIGELEKSKRGAYAGAVCYFGWDGSLDSCITLRTSLLKGGKAYVQAGAGVVADSDPTAEYQETWNKARAAMRSIALANTLGTK